MRLCKKGPIKLLALLFPPLQVHLDCQCREVHLIREEREVASSCQTRRNLCRLGE